MIKAYHSIYRTPLEEIVQAGVILPAAFRVDPDVLEGHCESLIDEIRETAFDEGGNWTAVKGIELLINNRLKEMASVSLQNTEETGFYCADLLARDVYSVFMSIGDWEDFGRKHPTGFVFDAEELINKGAIVRIGDLLQEYDDIITDMLWSKYKSPEKVMNILNNRLEEAKRENEISGIRAINYIRSSLKVYNELTYPGPLNLGLAKEVWDNGFHIA